MNKRELAILEKAFQAEISGMLPYQTKSKVAQKLADEGFLQVCKQTFGRGPLFAVCEGWQLTHAGCLAYCMTCKDEDA